ncbi:hypothetical protein ACQBAU_03945 [Propionibacteriaceae bacterium Y2011]
MAPARSGPARLRQPDRATEALPSAYMLEGPEFFEDEDPRYLSFLAGRVDLSSA